MSSIAEKRGVVLREKKSPEELLRSGLVIEVPVNGWSMYPLFTPGRDQAILTPFVEVIDRQAADSSESSKNDPDEEFPSVHSVRRGDVVLFRRTSGKLVLHRIFKVCPNEYWFVGDNLPDIERGIRKEQLIGMLTGFVRNGRTVDVKNLTYRVLSRIWLMLRPFRPLIHRVRRIGR